MAGYTTGTVNNPEEEEKEENMEGNIEESNGWGKEIAARENLEREGSLAGHAIGTDTERKDNEEEENAARNRS